MNVESLDDECRRILLCLEEHCIKSGSYIDYTDMAKRLDLTANCVSLVYDRLEQLALVTLAETMSGGKSACIARDGRIAADDLRRLPEKQRQQVDIEAKQRRRRRWSFYYEKLVIPIIIAIIAVLVGWFANSAWNDDASQQSDDLTKRNVEGGP